jgi:hypothetical protein
MLDLMEVFQVRFQLKWIVLSHLSRPPRKPSWEVQPAIRCPIPAPYFSPEQPRGHVWVFERPRSPASELLQGYKQPFAFVDIFLQCSLKVHLYIAAKSKGDFIKHELK